MKTKPVSIELTNQINGLHDLLKKEFGCDFAYTILGNGVVIGASNAEKGYLKPEIEANSRLLDEIKRFKNE